MIANRFNPPCASIQTPGPNLLPTWYLIVGSHGYSGRLTFGVFLKRGNPRSSSILMGFSLIHHPMVHFCQLLVKKCRVRVELWHFTMNRACPTSLPRHSQPIFYTLPWHFHVPTAWGSELLDRRHPNFRDFRSKAVLWQEKPSASFCKTPMNFRAAKLEGSILWRSLWLCDMLHIFHHLACPRNGSNWRLKSVSGMRRNSGRFAAGAFRARALQHLSFHHCIRSDTHARTRTHTGCQAALDLLF